MSPSLVPKPDDWKNNIGMNQRTIGLGVIILINRALFLDVVGFYFLDLAVNYQPPPELLAFMEAGETPIYIG
jgi:sterol 3beta-glucosyltransferase